jgi:hypothetical protein
MILRWISQKCHRFKVWLPLAEYHRLCVNRTKAQRDTRPETASPFPAPRYRSRLRLRASQSRDRPGRLQRLGKDQAPAFWERRTLALFGGANGVRPTTIGQAFCWRGFIRRFCCRLPSSGADPNAIHPKKTRLGIQETISPIRNHCSATIFHLSRTPGPTLTLVNGSGFRLGTGTCHAGIAVVHRTAKTLQG